MAQAVWKGFDSRGINVQKYFDCANLPRELIFNPGRIPKYQYFDCVSTITRAEGIDDIGFDGTMHFTRNQFHNFEAMCNAPTWCCLVQQIAHHTRRLADGADLKLIRGKDNSLWLCLRDYSQTPESAKLAYNQINIMNMICLARYALGDDWQPKALCLPGGTDCIYGLPQLLRDVSVKYGCGVTAIQLDPSILHFPMKEISLKTEACDASERLYQCQGYSNGVARLSAVLHSYLKWMGNVPSYVTASEIFGISPRSLHRHLHECDTGYRELVLNIRIEYALELLSQTATPIKWISQRLGYQNYTAFTRAFKSRNKMSPAQFRKYIQTQPKDLKHCL